MDQETRDMFNAVIGEIDKLAEKMSKGFEGFARLGAKIDRVNKNLTHEINACKLDRDVLALLVNKVDEHERRLDNLEAKAAYELV